MGGSEAGTKQGGLATVGFIGLGRMGTPMAKRLIEAGYKLVVCDVSKTAVDGLCAVGAEAAASAAEVAGRAAIIFLSLPGPDIVEAVALGSVGISTGKGASVVIDLSTIGSRSAVVVAEGLAKAGVTYIDAPVSGGVTGAAKGTLAIMCSGLRPVFERIKPMLDVLGRVFYVGERSGTGQSMKLVNNLMSVTALTITAEAMAMGVKAGLDPDVMIEVLNAGSGRNSATADKVPNAVMTRKFNFGFPLGLSLKDTRLCLEEAEAMGVPMLVGNVVRQVLTVAKAQHGADADMTAVALPIEAWAGVEIKGKGAA